jgi:hypothetical protein
MNQSTLPKRIDELVWAAWSAGARSGHPATSTRTVDREHARIWNELQEVITELENTLTP